MKLKTAANIEYTFDIILGVLYLPFKLISVIIYYILQPFVWLDNKRDDLMWYVGNRLLKRSDEVKTNYIKNKEMIMMYTARTVNRLLEKENGFNKN